MKKLSCLLSGFVFFCIATTALAQNAAGGMGERLFPAMGKVLTDQQRESLQQIMESERTQIRPLVDKLQTSRQGMLNQVISGDFNEGLARQYAAQSANAEADLAVIFARALSRMQPPLSPQQIAQLQNYQPGHLHEGRKDGKEGAEDESQTAPEVHLKMPAPLPTDTNGLPVVN